MFSKPASCATRLQFRPLQDLMRRALRDNAAVLQHNHALAQRKHFLAVDGSRRGWESDASRFQARRSSRICDLGDARPGPSAARPAAARADESPACAPGPLAGALRQKSRRAAAAPARRCETIPASLPLRVRVRAAQSAPVRTAHFAATVMCGNSASDCSRYPTERRFGGTFTA